VTGGSQPVKPVTPRFIHSARLEASNPHITALSNGVMTAHWPAGGPMYLRLDSPQSEKNRQIGPRSPRALPRARWLIRGMMDRSLTSRTTKHSTKNWERCESAGAVGGSRGDCRKRIRVGGEGGDELYITAATVIIQCKNFMQGPARFHFQFRSLGAP